MPKHRDCNTGRPECSLPVPANKMPDVRALLVDAGMLDVLALIVLSYVTQDPCVNQLTIVTTYGAVCVNVSKLVATAVAYFDDGSPFRSITLHGCVVSSVWDATTPDYATRGSTIPFIITQRGTTPSSIKARGCCTVSTIGARVCCMGIFIRTECPFTCAELPIGSMPWTETDNTVPM
jgi:hypothetical protein